MQANAPHPNLPRAANATHGSSASYILKLRDVCNAVRGKCDEHFLESAIQLQKTHSYSKEEVVQELLKLPAMNICGASLAICFPQQGSKRGDEQKQATVEV